MDEEIQIEVLEGRIPLKIIKTKNSKENTEEIAEKFFIKKGYKVLWTSYYNKNKYRHLNHIDSFHKEWKKRRGLRSYLFGDIHYFLKWEESNIKDKRLIKILLKLFIEKKIWKFLSKYYYANLKTGWSVRGIPDLFIYNKRSFYFVEIKSENDSLRLEQIKWINKANKVGIPTFVLWILQDKKESWIQNINKDL